MLQKELIEYIDEVIGQKLLLKELNKEVLKQLPFVFKNNYKFYITQLYGQKVILMLVKDEILNITQLTKQIDTIQGITEEPIAVVAENISFSIRKRLLENKISFIIPGKQLFLAPLLIHFQNFSNYKKTETLLPSAQVLILYHILHREDNLSQYSFRGLSEKFRYTQMGITKAVKNLEDLEFINVEGNKEKRIVFIDDIPELWRKAENYLVNPVFRVEYTDEKPVNFLGAGYTALEEYTDMNPGNQYGCAVERNEFYKLKKNKEFVNLNKEDGTYLIQVWKYNPLLLSEGVTGKNNVDPLSLYLSIKDGFTDERTEMALEQIINKYIW
jgi:DNA-binding MarR family transcriptional regulator